MRKMLKLPFALHNGAIIHISAVVSGRQPDCLCPECKRPLIARKGAIKQHHFAHDPGSQCNLESALHWLGKTLIHDGIRAAISNRTPINLRWRCSYCLDTHESNLVEEITSVEMERHLGQAKPDVLLIGQEGKPLTAIEVVVTHPLEEGTRAFYKASQINVVEIHLSNYDAINDLQDLSRLNATAVSICTRPKCVICEQPLSLKTIHVVDGACYRCGGAMKIGFCDVEGVCHGPEGFSVKDTEIALNRGCILREQFSHTTQSRYVANICGHCGAFTGAFYIHNYYDLADASTGIVTGKYCHRCKKHYEESL